MTNVVKRLIWARSWTMTPAATPRMEKTKQDASMSRNSWTVMWRSDVNIIPIATRMVPHIIPFTTPSSAFPKMIEVLDTGHRSISSKLS